MGLSEARFLGEFGELVLGSAKKERLICEERVSIWLGDLVPMK